MKLNSKKGFTIIEVVLVLAIAGLIFLMVFIALPNMQRTQRDRQRTNDYTALVSNMTNYLTNNNGKLPKEGQTLTANKYINTEGMDQSGNTYTIQVIDCKGSNASQKPCGAPIDELPDNKTPITVYVAINAKCSDTQGKAEVGDTLRAFAVIGPLETGVFCQNAQ